MRKALVWLLIACLAFGGLTVGALADENVSVNGHDVVNTGDDVYMAIPAAESGEMFVRVPIAGGDPVCLDRADSFTGVLPYAGGALYLKTTDGSSAIMLGKGNDLDIMYGFGGKDAEDLAVFNDDMLVLDDNVLYSIDPNTQVCLKLSGAQMLDYVLGDSCAYYLSGSDRMEYTANLDDGSTVKAQAGCIYRLDMKSGETTLLLKSGGTDLEIGGHNLFFRNVAEAYALRREDGTELIGKLYALDAQLKALTPECTTPVSDYWPMGEDVAYQTDEGIFVNDGDGKGVSIYAPEPGATIGSDGDSLYVWEPGKGTLTNVSRGGSTNILYTGDLTAATDATLILPEPTATAEAPADEGTEGGLTEGEGDAEEGNGSEAGWFNKYIEDEEGEGGSTSSGSGSSSSGSGSSSGSSGAQPTPLAGTPTPIPDFGDEDEDDTDDTSSTASSSSGSSSSSTQKSSSSSSKSSSSGSKKYSTYSVKGKYIQVINGTANVRSGPTMNHGVVTSVKKGTHLTFLNKGSKDSRGVRWYKVKANGKTGWISSKYAMVTYSKGGGGSSGSKVKTVGGSTKIRSKPSKSGKIKGYMGAGKTATYLGSAKKDSRGVYWYKVKYNGITGWVSSRYTKKY